MWCVALSSNYRLQQHRQRFHEGVQSETYKCTCGQMFASRHGLSDHIKFVHEGHTLKCTTCNMYEATHKEQMAAPHEARARCPTFLEHWFRFLLLQQEGNETNGPRKYTAPRGN